MLDKRKYPRKKMECQVQVNMIEEGESRVVRNSFCSDMSEIGAGIISFDFYPVNKKLYIKVLSNGLLDLLDVVGKVVWVKELPYQNKYKMGIQFEDVSENVHSRVRYLMNIDRES